MKILLTILITTFLFSSGFSQQKPSQKNSDKIKTSYNKDKAEKVQTVNNEKVTLEKQNNKIFGSAKKSGPEIKLRKDNNQTAISNEDLKKKLNNPRELKKEETK